MAYKMANNEEVLLTHWKGINYHFHWFDIFIVMKQLVKALFYCFLKWVKQKFQKNFLDKSFPVCVVA